MPEKRLRSRPTRSDWRPFELPSSFANLRARTVTSPLTHFEIYADEPAKLAEFYQLLFGWKIEQAPGLDYWRIQTGATHCDQVNGGLTYRPLPELRSWIHYLHVDSLDHTVEELLKLGGTVLRPRTALPKTAWYAVVADPEGNVFPVWEADPTAMP